MKTTPLINPRSVLQEVARNHQVRQHNPSPGGTMPAGPVSSCPSHRKSTRCRTLWTKREQHFIGKKKKKTQDGEKDSGLLLTLIHCQDLWMEILGVDFLHHVLVYGQPQGAHAQFSGPWVAQLLHRTHGNNQDHKTWCLAHLVNV